MTKRSSNGNIPTISKFIAVVIVLLGIAYLITSLVLGCWNPIKWREKDTTTPVGAIEIDDNTVAVDNDGNQLNENQVYAMPRNIMFMATKTASSRTSSVNIRATITPENADDKRVTWSSSDTASVIVTPNEDDPLTATVTCLRVFDYAVNVTCTSIENPEAKAVCRVDYLVSGDGLTLNGNFLSKPEELVFGNYYTATADFSSYNPSSGTIIGKAENITWSLNLNSDFISTVDNYLSQKGYSEYKYMLSGNDCSFDATSTRYQLYNSPYTCFYAGDCSEEVFNNAFKLAMRDCDVHATLTIHADYVYDGKNYGTYDYDRNLKFSMSGIWIGVDNVDIDDNIIFGT